MYNWKPKIVPSVLFNFKLFKDVGNGVNNDKGNFFRKIILDKLGTTGFAIIIVFLDSDDI